MADFDGSKADLGDESMNPFKEKKIVVGITGSIAAYKATEIASTLTKSGANVFPVLTPSGEKFITPLTLHSVTGAHASTDRDLWESDQHVTHIFLGHNADLIMVAPASANFISKMAHGQGDSLLALAILASHCPILVAPAMDGDMYQNLATQANVRLLKERGIHFVGPDSGHLASGMSGVGRMSPPQEVLNQARYLLSRNGVLKGKTILVTAGGTREPIDPVRFVANRSSGKQGYAIAQEALNQGADVILISTPTVLPVPFGAELIPVQTAAEMEKAVLSNLNRADALVMSAAVADFRPTTAAEQKIKKMASSSNYNWSPQPTFLRKLAGSAMAMRN